MVRTSASGAVDSSLIPNRVKPKNGRLVFTASLSDPQQGTVWKTMRQVYSLCRRKRSIIEIFHLKQVSGNSLAYADGTRILMER